MDPYERSKLGDAVKETTVKKDDMIIKEGEEGQTFYLISEGTAIATKKMGGAQPETVKEYKRGDYFGERALIKNENRAANIIITSDEAVLLSLERETFNRLLGPLEI